MKTVQMPKGGSATAPTREAAFRQRRDALAIHFFEILLTSGNFDVRAPMQAALCAKNCAEVILGVLGEGNVS